MLKKVDISGKDGYIPDNLLLHKFKGGCLPTLKRAEGGKQAQIDSQRRQKLLRTERVSKRVKYWR